MIKKAVLITLSLCLLFSISVMAEDTDALSNTESPAASQELPSNGEQSNVGAPPETQNGEMPQEGNRGGQMPEDGFTPPQNVETNNAEGTAPQTDGNTEETAQLPENTGENDPESGGNAPFGGQMPEGGFPPPQNVETNNAEGTVPQTDGNTEETAQPPENTGENDPESGGNAPFDGQMPGNMGDFNFPGGMANNAQNTETEQATSFIGFIKTYSTPITSVILLICAFVFVYFYKRKQY